MQNADLRYIFALLRFNLNKNNAMKLTPIVLLAIMLTAFSCTDNGEPDIDVPPSYTFLRDGSPTVSYSGQTTRIDMASELVNGLIDLTSTEATLQEMYSNTTADGGDANPFAQPDLNESTKSVRSKVAASLDYFATNTVAGTAIKNEVASWITGQVEEIFPASGQVASQGQAGQLADGSTARYVNSQGLEYNQAVNKGLIGALMADQMLNHYLSPAVLDAGSNRTDNDNDVTVDGEAYTNMEHKWDEAYGYLFGLAENTASPLESLGNDLFLSKYLGRVENDPDFTGMAQTIFDAFKLGRAAIVAGDYDLRDQQADIIKEEVSSLIGIRSVYYLQQGKLAIEAGNIGTGFHDLSEGYGFIYSLQFTRKAGSDDPYFTRAEVTNYLDQLLAGDGFWSVSSETLDAMSADIADRFDWSVEEAAD